MPDERLRIVVEAKDKATAALKGLQKSLKGIGASGKTADGGLTKTQKAMGLLKAVAGAFVVREGVKLIAKLAVIGAEAERVSNSFVAMTGGTAQAASMLEALREATRGAKSDMELMEGAANLLALGLADDAESLGSIVKNVEALGSRFGGTMQIFQLMMSNQSLMRIDSFGIGVEEATKRIDEFKDAGMNAEEAFKTAILELMGEKFEQLGGNVEDAKLELERMEASWKNFVMELGLGFKDMGAGVAGPGAKLFNWLTDLQRGYREARKETKGFFRTFRSGVRALAGDALPYWVKEANRAEDATASLTGAMYQLHTEALTPVVEETENATSVTKPYVVAQYQMQQALGKTNVQMFDYHEYLEDINAETELAAELNEINTSQLEYMASVFSSNLTPSLEDARDKVTELRDREAELIGKIGELEGKRYLTESQKGDLADLQEELGETRTSIQGVISDIDEMLGRTMMSIVMSMITVDDKVEETELEFYGAMGNMLGLWDENFALMLTTAQTNLNLVKEGFKDPQQGAEDTIAVNDGLIESYLGVAADGVWAMDEITAATGLTEGALIQAKSQASGLHSELDNLPRHIAIEVVITERRKQAHSAQGEAGYAGDPSAFGIGNQGGFNGVVTQPTTMRVGEAGPERVTVSPIHNYNMTVNTAATSDTYGQDFYLLQAMAQ